MKKNIQRLLAVLAALLLPLLTVQADEVATVEISSAAELKAFADRVNAGEQTLNAVLTADIDMTGVTMDPNAKMGKEEIFAMFGSHVAAPMKKALKAQAIENFGYKGKFDGQGHTISNLDMKFAGMTGLFSFIFGGKVTNLIITNSSFTNISTYNDVEETDGALLYTGSIAAFNIGEITNCHVHAIVRGVMYMGGICCAVMSDDASQQGVLTDCVFKGAVVMDWSNLQIPADEIQRFKNGRERSVHIGGLFAEAEGSCQIKNNLVKGTVTAVSPYFRPTSVGTISSEWMNAEKGSDNYYDIQRARVVVGCGDATTVISPEGGARAFGTNSEYDIFYGKAFDNITDGTVVGAGKNMGYDVFVKAGIENGTVTVDKKEADVDEAVTITLTADEGCRLKSVTVEKVATTGQADSRAAVPGIGDFVEPTDNGDGTWSFQMPANDVLVSAVFEVIPVFNITVDENITNGTVTVDKETAEEGETITVTVTAASGYQLKSGSLTATGVTLTSQGNDKYTFKMPAHDVEVTAQFEQKETPPDPEPPHTANIIILETEHGTVTVNHTFIENEYAYLTITPEKGYKLESLKITTASGQEIGYNRVFENKPWDVTIIRFLMPGEDVYVKATFTKIKEEGYHPTPVDPDDHNDYVVVDPDDGEVVVIDFPDSPIIIIPGVIEDEVTGEEFVVTGVDDDALDGHEDVTDIYIEGTENVIDINEEKLIDKMPNAIVHVYQTLLKSYADRMKHLVQLKRLVTDIENEEQQFTFSNACHVEIPEDVKQFICAVQQSDASRSEAAANVTVVAERIDDRVITADKGVMLKAQPGIHIMTAMAEAGKGDYTKSELKPIQVKTTLTPDEGLYILKNGVFVHPTAEVEVLDGKAVLRTAAGLPNELTITDGTIVGISTLQAEQTEGRSWYQLDGRRVDTPTQKGIYIQNGKKLIIK